MDNNTEKNLKSKHITVSFYTGFTLYFLIGVILRIVNHSVIIGISKILFIMMFIVLPVIILALPFILKAAGKKNFGDCVKTAFIVSLIYATVSVGTEFGTKVYFTNFTPEKWDKYPSNRHLMLNDFEENYNIIGMTKNDVKNLLGETQTGGVMGDEALIYGILNVFFTDEYYAVIYDDNGIVTETYTGRTLEVL